MDVNHNFSSISNKRLLWDLLVDNNIFSGVSADKEDIVKKLFESTIVSVSSDSIYGNGTNHKLSDLNKKFINNIITEINKLKTKKKVSFQSSNVSDNKNNREHISPPGFTSEKKLGNEADNNYLKQHTNVMSDRNVMTAEKQQQIRQDDFNMKLENRQKEFTSMINSNKPPTIDFKDNEEDETISDMDQRLAAIMNSREIDMKNIFKDKPPQRKELSNNTDNKASKKDDDNTRATAKNTEKDNKQDNKQDNEKDKYVEIDSEVSTRYEPYVSSHNSRRLVIKDNIELTDIILVKTDKNDFEGQEFQKEFHSMKEMIKMLVSTQKTILERLDEIKIL